MFFVVNDKIIVLEKEMEFLERVCEELVGLRGNFFNFIEERDFFVFEKKCLEEIVCKFREEFEEVERFFIVLNERVVILEKEVEFLVRL